MAYAKVLSLVLSGPWVVTILNSPSFWCNNVYGWIPFATFLGLSKPGLPVAVYIGAGRPPIKESVIANMPAEALGEQTFVFSGDQQC